jgi:hypothetical protein
MGTTDSNQGRHWMELKEWRTDMSKNMKYEYGRKRQRAG